MQLITAIVRPTKVPRICEALQAFGFHGLTVTEAVGLGKRRGRAEIYRGVEYLTTPDGSAAGVPAPGRVSIDYFRGAAAGNATGQQIVRATWRCILVAFTILMVVLAIQAINENTRMYHLRHRGVVVNATVTGCVGSASGTGITVTGYNCRATFTLDGHRYTDLIRGSERLRSPGDRLAVVTDPDHPATLSTVRAAATTPPQWKAFVPAAIALALLCVLTMVGWRRSVPGSAGSRTQSDARHRDGGGDTRVDRPGD